jgi:L-ornithine N5-oxygenase
MVIHDVIGIGFGPSNIALAIALDGKRRDGRRLDAMFIEKQPGFAWHKDMMLEHAHMQISFLKDLATLRNPTSRFTFINYLHEKKRLQDFINLKTFFPSRHEFNDYLAWAAAQFEDACVYGEEVFEVLPEREAHEEDITLLRVRSRDRTGHVTERLARNLVVSIGGMANVPDCFRPLRSDPRVFHSSTYLRDIAAQDGAQKIAIVGAGQSAAEIFMDLQGKPHAPREWPLPRCQTTDRDRNEDQVVDAEHDLERRQREQRDPDLRIRKVLDHRIAIRIRRNAARARGPSTASH